MWILSLWRYCHHGDIVTMWILSLWRYCHHGDIVTMEILSQWGCCHHGDIVTMEILSQWGCCHHGDIVTMEILSQWGCCHHGDIVTMELLSPWGYRDRGGFGDFVSKNMKLIVDLVLYIVEGSSHGAKAIVGVILLLNQFYFVDLCKPQEILQRSLSHSPFLSVNQPQSLQK